ncbi:zinc finger BED domain-containing protein RICESLEEPER 2-like [Rhododendron vialii]|uniref:zinc finger BED domain-containing protein RICESLEEPER 2-like n=1 Tax=Rhododendron vialii TaxID=182163 RepID=UPI00265E24A6|nr:zinc finger BED domain-containing protein RICESLEEPER 2-like [Rhododendron vialii]
MDPENIHFDNEGLDLNPDDDEPTLPAGRESVGEAASNIAAGFNPTGVTGCSQSAQSSGTRRYSWVWKHASIVDNYKNAQGIDLGSRAVCNYCPNNYTCVSKGGVGHLQRHLENKHKKFKHSEVGVSGESGGFDSVGGTSNFVYSQSSMREGLARYVVAAEQPFTFGDDIRFEYFVKHYLNPLFSKVSRNTTRSDSLKAFIEVRKVLMSEIAELGSLISFTSDLWSGRNNLGYISVTAHYIDSNWILNKKIIAFRLMEEFEIVDKVFSITFDNHSANTSSIDLFKQNLTTLHAGQFFHVRCLGNKNLKDCVNHADVISAYINSKHMRTDGGLTRGDWKIAFEFMNFLKIFYAATLACSGVRYPTTCIVLNHLYNMSHTLKSHRTKPNFVAACKSMEDKFNKYFENMPTIFIVASVMDPRIKARGVEKLLKGLGENLGITLPSISTITALLTSIYASYESKFACTTAAPYSSSINDPCSTSNNENDPSWFLISGPSSSETLSRSELTQYLEINLVTNEEFQSFDILAWWKKTEKTFPILSIMARDLLTPPVSSVASESAFSAGNRVLDERRSRLAPDILDCLICLKDWEDARLGIQRCHPRDEFRDYFSDSDIDAD